MNRTKKIAGALLCIVGVAAGALSFTACGEHEHVFSEDWQSDSASHWHGCTVDDCTEKNSVEEHTFGEWSVVIAATSSSGGQDKRTCSVCDYTQTRSTDKIVHTHTYPDEWEYDETSHWRICTDDTCKNRDGFAKHDWDEGVIDPEPTEEAEGVKTFSCTQEGCNATYTKTLDILDHSHRYPEDWETDDEEHWKVCLGKNCNEEIRGEHTWDTEDEKAEATCTECGLVREARNHVFSKFWSYSEEGHFHKCKDSGCDEIDELISHTLVWKSKDGEHWQTCSVCSYKTDAEEHDYDDNLLCICDVVTEGVTYTIKDGKGEFTTLSTTTSVPTKLDNVLVIAAYVRDVDGKAVPCDADDEGAVPVTSIGTDACSYQGDYTQIIEEVYAPETITKIGVRAFAGCRKLVTFRTKAKITNIGDNAFYVLGGIAPGFTGFDLSWAAYIGVEAFTETSVSEVNLSSIINIGHRAFEGCKSIKSVTFSQNIQRVNPSAFAGCINLESVDFGGLSEITSNVFQGCVKLNTLKNVESIREIQNRTFEGCKALESFDFTNVTAALKTAFLNAGLKSLTIPAEMHYNYDSFTGNPVTTLTFSEGVTAISEPVDGLAQLVTVNLPSTLEEIGASIFAKSANVETINYNGTKAQFLAMKKDGKWDAGLKNITMVFNDETSCTLEELFTVGFTELTQTGTVTGETNNNSEVLYLDNYGHFLYVVYYSYTLTEDAKVTISVNPEDADTFVFTSLKSFRDISERLFNNPYLGNADGERFASEYYEYLEAGETIYLAALKIDITGEENTGEFKFAINCAPPLELHMDENTIAVNAARDNKPGQAICTFTARTSGTYEFRFESQEVTLCWEYTDENGQFEDGRYNPRNKEPNGDNYWYASISLSEGTNVKIFFMNSSTNVNSYTLDIKLVQE